MPIADNIATIQERIAAVIRKAGRPQEAVTLMAVTKTVSSAAIQDAYDAGLRVFGESRVQEFERKAEALSHLKDARWHMIGHLQSNKAAKAAELFSAFDSVDSLRLARKLDDAAGKLGKKLPILIEINIGGESAKSGILPESAELEEFLQAAPELSHLEIRGLMTVPPFTENIEDSRPFFRRLAEMRRQIAARRLPQAGMDELSMGMSHDFEIAIEEGSTCVRVGTAIFGEREYPAASSSG